MDDYKEGIPARQGFYKVRTKVVGEHIAEWREHDTQKGKRWWMYVSDDPTVEKRRVPLDDVIAYAKAEPYEVERFLRRHLTQEENIQASYERFVTSRDGFPACFVPIPENRRLSLGQAVTLGARRGCTVIGIHEGGQAVTVEYRETKRKFSEVVDLGPATSTMHWLDVLPVCGPTTCSLATTPNYRTQSYFNTQLLHMVKRFYHTGMTDNPKYQRGYAWTLADMDRYLDTLFSGRDLGRFIFIKQKYPHPDELFDGKQRMSTLIALISSQLPYKGVYWHEMSHEDRVTAMNRSVQFADLDADQYSEVELLEMFLDVNAAGVPQTQEHLDFVNNLLIEARAAAAAGGTQQ